MTDREKRISEMEEKFDKVSATLEKYIEAENEFEKILPIADELKEYYTGGSWLSDYEADEHGEISPVLKRGILSQDALYNLFEKLEETKRGKTE